MRPVARVVNGKIQYFPVAGLIFTDDVSSNNIISSVDLYEIQKRFKSIVNGFDQAEKNYNSSSIGNKTSLPFNSKAAIHKTDEQLILNFEYSYNKPLLLVYDLKQKRIQNYVDINKVKSILNDLVYESTIEGLYSSCNLDRIYRNVDDFNKFISSYKKILENYKNENTVSGYECIEIDL